MFATQKIYFTPVTHSDGGHIIFSPGDNILRVKFIKKPIFFRVMCVLFSILMLVTVKEDYDGALTLNCFLFFSRRSRRKKKEKKNKSSEKGKKKKMGVFLKKKSAPKMGNLFFFSILGDRVDKRKHTQKSLNTF